MRNVDFTPLYRSAVGFDRVADLLDTLGNSEAKQAGYPPYNVEVVDENQYRVTLALAGFQREDLEIEAEQNKLVVRGRKPADNDQRQFLHRGIAARNFERRFQLADHVRVGGAILQDGLLHINLQREVPEATKPRRIDIRASASPKS